MPGWSVRADPAALTAHLTPQARREGSGDQVVRSPAGNQMQSGANWAIPFFLASPNTVYPQIHTGTVDTGRILKVGGGSLSLQGSRRGLAAGSLSPGKWAHGPPRFFLPLAPQSERQGSTPPWSQNQGKLREGCSGKRRNGGRELWSHSLPAVWPWARWFPSLGLSTRFCKSRLASIGSHIPVCCRNPPGLCLKFRFLTPTPRGFGWDWCRRECF